MRDHLPKLYLARHGETEWSLSGQHTGLTDLTLTPRGEEHARLLGARLRQFSFARVFTSPLRRAAESCRLAGFEASVMPDLVEWNYGDYEGKKSAEITANRPGWRIFRDGAPGGESPENISNRVDRVIAAVRAISGDVLLFSSGHLLRALAARWIRQEVALGECLLLGTASLSILAYDHNLDEPAIRLWNDTSHLP